MPELLQLRLFFDFAMVVLIWIVQLIIYPSFLYYAKDQFIIWHQHYMIRFSFIVAPLMLIQTIIIGLQFWAYVDVYTIMSLILITYLWISTTIQFVPLHLKLTTPDYSQSDLQKLVRWNWTRTVIWTLLFLISILNIVM